MLDILKLCVRAKGGHTHNSKENVIFYDHDTVYVEFQQKISTYTRSEMSQILGIDIKSIISNNNDKIWDIPKTLDHEDFLLKISLVGVMLKRKWYPMPLILN